MESNDIINRNTAVSGLFFTGIAVASCGVIVALLQEKTGISYNEAGVILSSLSFGQLISAFLTGVLPAKIGIKKTVNTLGIGIFLGYVIMMLCSIFRPEGLFIWLIFCFAFIGMGKGSVINVSNMLSAKTSEPTKNLNLENAGYALGALLSPLLISFFGNEKIFAWWTPMLTFSVVGAMLYLLFYRASIPDAESKAKVNDFSFLRNRRFWNVTIILFCQQCIEIGVTGWLVTYFRDTGILTGFLGQLTVSVIWLSIMMTRLWVAFRFKGGSLSRLLFIMGIGALISYTALLSSKSAPFALIFLALFGMSIGGIYPVAISSAGSFLTNESMGTMLPIAAIGAITMPSIMGMVAGAAGIHAGMLVIVIALVIYFIGCTVMMIDDKKRA